MDPPQVAGPARREGAACLASPPLFSAPVPPVPGEQRRGRAQHVLDELPLAGQQPFRQLGPLGITRRNPVMLTKLCLLLTILIIVIIPSGRVTSVTGTVAAACPRRNGHACQG